jgi:hypothetical protein
MNLRIQDTKEEEEEDKSIHETIGLLTTMPNINTRPTSFLKFHTQISRNGISIFDTIIWVEGNAPCNSTNGTYLIYSYEYKSIKT